MHQKPQLQLPQLRKTISNETTYSQDSFDDMMPETSAKSGA